MTKNNDLQEKWKLNKAYSNYQYIKMHYSTSRVSVRDLQVLTERWRDDRVGLYDRVLPKMPDGDVFMAIPKGRRCNIWFTHFKETPACFIVETNRSNDITNILQVSAVFDKELSYGTIISGVLVNTEKGVFFCSIIIQRALGNLCKRSLKNQLDNMKKVHSLIGGKGLPVLQITVPDIFTSFKAFNEKLTELSYPIYGVKIGSTIRDHSLGIVIVEVQKSKECVLLVKPEVNEDLYSLWSDGLIGYALIPDIRTSKLLNSIFRIVKENDNLDEIEESDDEDEFENIEEDRFIKVPNGRCMNVVYDFKHRGWVPISLSVAPPTRKQDIKNIESRNTMSNVIKKEVQNTGSSDRGTQNRINHSSRPRKPMRFMG